MSLCVLIQLISASRAFAPQAETSGGAQARGGVKRRRRTARGGSLDERVGPRHMLAPAARVEAWLIPGGDCTRGCTTRGKLHWWGKGLGDAECTALASYLTTTHGELHNGGRVQNLLLGSNDLGDECAEALAVSAAVGALSGLRSLGLSRNKLTNRGCSAVARSLRHMPDLRDLFLSKQADVGDACMAALVAAFREFPAPNLTRIGLSYNNVSAGVVSALLSVAPVSLMELSLDHNSHCLALASTVGDQAAALDGAWAAARASTRPRVSLQCRGAARPRGGGRRLGGEGRGASSWQAPPASLRVAGRPSLDKEGGRAQPPRSREAD